MGSYLVKRLGYSVLVLLMVSVLIFLISRLSGDPAALMAPPEARAEDIQAIRTNLGLDKPLHEQYLIFISNAVRGDLGTSLWQKQPALNLVLERFPATLELAVTAMAFATLLGIPLGIIAAIKRDGFIDRLTMMLAVLGQSVPNFWLGMMLILIFASLLHWLPSSGRGTWQHLLMPALTLSAFPLARIARLTRSGLLEVLHQDYIRTARSKGLTESAIILKHALRNAAIPIVTVMGLQIGGLLGGAVIVETVFAWPGLGRLVVQSVFMRDFPLVQASTLFIAVIFVLVNLLVDLSYSLIDPRIKTAG